MKEIANGIKDIKNIKYSTIDLTENKLEKRSLAIANSIKEMNLKILVI